MEQGIFYIAVGVAIILEYQRDCKLGTKPVECLPDADEMGHCRLPIHKAIFR